MPKGKQWTPEEELKLNQLLLAGNPYHLIAAQLSKSEEAIRQKIKRLGLQQKEVEHPSLTCSTTSEHTPSQQLSLPAELPSIEDALKILATALKLAHNPNQNLIEIKRLYAVAKLAKIYKELLADYIDYRSIETKLVELEEKYAKLAEKSQSRASKPDTGAADEAYAK